MRNVSSEFLSEAQQAHRSMYQTIQALAETQFKMLQRLADVQREQFNQALEAARDQLRLLSSIRDPREFTSAQASLVQDYGQRYVDSVNEAVSIISTAWEEYGNQLEKRMSAAADTFQRAVDTTTQAAEETTERAAASSKKTTSSRKTS